MTCDPTNPGQTHWDGCDCSRQRDRREAAGNALIWAYHEAEPLHPDAAILATFCARGLTALGLEDE